MKNTTYVIKMTDWSVGVEMADYIYNSSEKDALAVLNVLRTAEKRAQTDRSFYIYKRTTETIDEIIL